MEDLTHEVRHTLLVVARRLLELSCELRQVARRDEARTAFEGVSLLPKLDHVRRVLVRAQLAHRVLAVLHEAREHVVQHLLIATQLLQCLAVVEACLHLG